jgi:hypothetical protein
MKEKWPPKTTACVAMTMVRNMNDSMDVMIFSGGYYMLDYAVSSREVCDLFLPHTLP